MGEKEEMSDMDDVDICREIELKMRWAKYR